MGSPQQFAFARGSPFQRSGSPAFAMAAAPPADWEVPHIRRWVWAGNNAYTVLGIPETADEVAVAKAWKKVYVRYHPDKHPRATEAVLASNREVLDNATAAKQILSVHATRQVHDQTAGNNGFLPWPPAPAPGETPADFDDEEEDSEGEMS